MSIEKKHLMKRKVVEIVSETPMTDNTREFLKKCLPSYGNLLYNEKKRSENDPDIVGYARLDDGRVVRIEGKPSNKGDKKLLPIRIVLIPEEVLETEGEHDNTFF